MHTKLTPTNLKCRKKKSCGNLKALFLQCDTYYVLTQIQSELKKLFVYYRNIDYFVCLSPYSNSLEGKIAFTDDLIRIFSLCCQKIDFFNLSLYICSISLHLFFRKVQRVVVCQLDQGSRENFEKVRNGHH